MLQPNAKTRARIAKRFVVIGNHLLAVQRLTIHPKSPAEQKFPGPASWLNHMAGLSWQTRMGNMHAVGLDNDMHEDKNLKHVAERDALQARCRFA
jgi:hypothetical protein